MKAHLAQSKSFILTLGLLTATAALTVDLSLPAIPTMVEAPVMTNQGTSEAMVPLRASVSERAPRIRWATV